MQIPFPGITPYYASRFSNKKSERINNKLLIDIICVTNVPPFLKTNKQIYIIIIQIAIIQLVISV